MRHSPMRLMMSFFPLSLAAAAPVSTSAAQNSPMGPVSVVSFRADQVECIASPVGRFILIQAGPTSGPSANRVIIASRDLVTPAGLNATLRRCNAVLIAARGERNPDLQRVLVNLQTAEVFPTYERMYIPASNCGR